MTLTWNLVRAHLRDRRALREVERALRAAATPASAHDIRSALAMNPCPLLR